MGKTLKRISLFLFCAICLIPFILVATGNATITRRGGSSTMGVIVGPIFGLDDPLNPGVVLGPDVTVDYSNSNLSADSPYASGALRAYKSIGVYNVVRDSKSWNGFKYASFIRYFRIVRTDGRVIYDDDGVLDVSTDKAKLADEIVNYPSYIYSIETKLPIKSNAGFLWTDQQAKFKSGAQLKCTYYFSDAVGTMNMVYDLPENPTDKTRTLVTIMYADTYNTDADTYDCLAVNLSATGQYKNTFWGNTGGDTSVSANLTNYIAIGERDWTNELVSNATKGIYNGKTAYYSPKTFTVIASNLNNFVKINNVQATPQYGTSVVPYKDGHHIEISDEGYTIVEIENGAENVYTTYYCMVDTKLPEIDFAYHNENALDTRKVGTITTNANGAKTQTINQGIFKDEVQILFSYDETTESPEVATYTFNGITQELTSGTWLTNEGDYTVTINDLAGNTTISKFTIDKSAPSYNFNRLQNDTTYKVAKWYLADIPYGYTGYGSYSFREKVDALSFACSIEKQNCVTEYYLDNIDDFTNTHLLASGNEVKIGKYWYYKSRENPNLYVYYFDENSLNESINYYAKDFVSDEQIYKQNSSIYPNNYGNTIDKSIYDNIVEVNGINSYLATDFIFRQTDTNESYKIYCDYQEGAVEEWLELQYNIALKNQLTTHGLYKIKEVDYVGHTTTYFVYLDLQSPMVDFDAKVYGSDKTISQSISINDIPQNGELIFYYENFSITEIIEDDKWWTMEIRLPNGTIQRYTYLDTLPNFDELGSGEYTISVADRTNTVFKFKVCLLGTAPEVIFENINSNTALQITINNTDDTNIITDIKIYRNDICLNSNTGYDEFPDDDTNELIFISPNTLFYTFNRGGIYIVEITDNYGRTLTYEYKFEKDLPVGYLTGVSHNGKTNGNVMFTFDESKYEAIVTKNNKVYIAEQEKNNNVANLYFYPEENTEFVYIITLIDRTDTENYNTYKFTIKTIKPIINLFGVEPNGKTGGSVYATWEQNDEQYTACYTLNGNTQEYRKGQILTVAGSYTIELSDELGNTSYVNFTIDKTIDFTIADISGNTYKIEDIEYINFGIRILEDEPLNITIKKDNSQIDYEFGLIISDEGFYSVTLVDEFNNTLYFTFTIDTTPPVATLYGVENFGTTSKSAWVASMESGLTCYYLLDDVKFEYKLGTELKASGNYKVFIEDRAKNVTTFEFSIDNTIAYDINIYHGGISNGGVRIIAYENLRIVMYKDGQPFDYSFEQILNEDGEYSFTLVDDLGNKTSSFFSIITKKQKNLSHILQENISVKSITKDDEDYQLELTENKLYLYDEGVYKVTILDENFNKEYSFEITIDTTPPTLELVGATNGGTTKKVVIMKNVSEEPYSIYITVDGIPFEYKLGDEIEKSGQFIVILTDEAGNSTTYTFGRLYSLNGPSIAVLAGLGTLVVLLIVLLIKSRHHYYKDEIVEEEIEETVIEDDFLDENPESDENSENDERN